MDGLSTAASLIAVTSLAFQLAEQTRKLFEFWDSIQHAPEEINNIKSELESLRSVLEQIGHEAQHQPSSPSMASALRLCSGKIDTIRSLTADFESGLTCSRIRTRKWSALRAVFKREKIEKVQNSLDRLKATLVLVLLNNVGRSYRLRDERYNHDIQALTRQIGDLRLHSLAGQVIGTSSASTNSQSHVLARTHEIDRTSNLKRNDTLAFEFKNDTQKASINFSDPTLTRSIYPSPSTWSGQSTQTSPSSAGLPFRRAIWKDDKVVETFFGTFRMSSITSLLFSNRSEGSTCSEEGDGYEYKNIFTLIPSSWLARFGFTYGLSGHIFQSPLSGPTVALDVVRSVPDDAVIFNLCMEGNFGCVQALLNIGQASVKDVDSQGRTPLYFAAESCHVELCKLLIRCGADRDPRIYDDADRPYYDVRNPLFAIAFNKVKAPYNPDRVIDTLRLFIDLVDVSHFEDDCWTSGSNILPIISHCHKNKIEASITGDVFLWTLEILGPDLWESLDEDEFYSSMFWCLDYGEEERAQRLFKLCNNDIDAHGVNGFSLLHTAVICGGLIPLLTMGANVNLLGFNPEESPQHETPISLSMYRANTFVKMQNALKTTAANFETTFNQALEGFPLQYPRWTKEALVELFSEDLDISSICYYQRLVCPYCSYTKDIMVQPYWMRILESVMGRTRSQSIQNVVGTMLSTNPDASTVSSSDDHETEETFLHPQMQKQNSADSEIEDEHLFERDDKPIFEQPDDEEVKVSSICDGITIDDEDMCLFCWHKWRATGLRPSLDESKCSCCGQSLSSPESMGRCSFSRHYCRICEIRQRHADFAMKQKQKRRPPPKIDPDDEQDHYSPYLIHT